MYIKANVTDRTLVTSLLLLPSNTSVNNLLELHDGRANQRTVDEASLQPFQENTLCDGCRKTAETFVKAESPVAAELLIRPKCAKRMQKFQIVDVRPIRARRKLNF